jgi:hypothetical protein
MGTKRIFRTPRIGQPRTGAGRLFAVFFLGALLGGVGWFAFEYGREWAGLSNSIRGLSVKRLRNALNALEDERDALRQQLAALERASQIDQEASRLAQLELKKYQEENQELEKDVEFLRNLVEHDAEGALRIKEFKLAAGEEERTYNYRFTVSQAKPEFGVSKGRILVSVEGSLDGTAKTTALDNATDVKTDVHVMKFRHFQNIQGSILLPKGFSPDNMVVEVKPDSKKLSPLRESFDWVEGG